jgi:glycosyltransferase involved in cell wall biosynthesis
MSQKQKSRNHVWAVTDAPAIDWPLFSWIQPLAERGFAFTILADKLPQFAWLASHEITAVSAGTVSQMASDPQLNGRSGDIYYFASLTAAADFARHRVIDGHFVVQATNWELAVLPYLAASPPRWSEIATVLKQAGRVVVATQALRETAVALGAAPQKVVVVSPGVNLDIYRPAAPVTISADAAIHLLAVISLEWASGMEYLLHAIRCGRDAGLQLTADVVGYGSGRQRLYYLLDDFQLFDVVQPVNHLPRAALREKFQQAHFLMQPNLTDDVSPTTFEAMACGLPPLAFAGPNWAELLGDAAPSLLSPLRQPQAMAEAMVKLAHNPATYAAVREQVQQLAVTQHDLSHQVAQMDTLFALLRHNSATVLDLTPPPPEPQFQPANKAAKSRKLVSVPQVMGTGEMPPLPDGQMPQLAVATVAVGEPYARWALAMIESVRGNGRFQGPIYVVTDCAHLFSQLENVPILAVPETAEALEAKQYKTWLPEWIPFEQTLFLDADVVVGRPLFEWYTAVSPELQTHTLLMFPDEGFFGERYHTGVILMRKQVAPLLARWRSAIQGGSHTRDQAAFMAVADPEAVYLMPAHFLLFPTIETFKRSHHTTFNHITFTGRQRNFSAAVIQRYLAQALHLAQQPLTY